MASGEGILASLSDRLLTLDRVTEANERKRVSAEDTLAFIESKTMRRLSKRQ